MIQADKIMRDIRQAKFRIYFIGWPALALSFICIYINSNPYKAESIKLNFIIAAVNMIGLYINYTLLDRFNRDLDDQRVVETETNRR